MNPQQVKQLLELYYKGDSSAEDEERLSIYFQRKEVVEEFKIDQIQFLYYQSEKQTTTSKDYLEPLRSTSGKVVSLSSRIKFLTAIAASFLLLSASLYFLNRESDNNELTAQEIKMEQSKQAYAEVKKTLLLVSEKLNKGTKEVHKISKFNKVQNSIIQQ